MEAGTSGEVCAATWEVAPGRPLAAATWQQQYRAVTGSAQAAGPDRSSVHGSDCRWCAGFVSFQGGQAAARRERAAIHRAHDVQSSSEGLPISNAPSRSRSHWTQSRAACRSCRRTGWARTSPILDVGRLEYTRSWSNWDKQLLKFTRHEVFQQPQLAVGAEGRRRGKDTEG